MAGAVVATGGADARLVVDTEDGPLEAVPHRDLLNDVRIAPDRATVATVSRDRTVALTDLRSGRSRRVGRHDHWAMGVAWAPDGTALATVSEDRTVRVWDRDGAELARIAHRWPINAVDWSAAGLVVATGDRRLLRVDLDRGAVEELGRAEQMLWAVRARDGVAAWAGRDRWLRTTDLGTGETVGWPAHGAQIWDVRWWDDRIVTPSADGTAAVWTVDGQRLATVELGVWVRAAAALGGALLLATEDGELVRCHGPMAALPAPPVVAPDAGPCEHWHPAVTTTTVRRCAECGSPEELRLCVTCGHVGCCESQLAHATKHWEATGHPVTIPVRPAPTWRWCYAHDRYLVDR